MLQIDQKKPWCRVDAALTSDLGFGMAIWLVRADDSKLYGLPKNTHLYCLLALFSVRLLTHLL